MRAKEITKETIIRWSKAVELHNSERYMEAAECYFEIKDVSARMCYNQACAYIKLDNVDNAIQERCLKRKNCLNTHDATYHLCRSSSSSKSSNTCRNESLSRAIDKDEYLAIAYFQRGTLYLQNNSTLKAIADLEMAHTLLRGNTYIYYKPLGLYTTLSSFLILQNLALAYVTAERLEDAQRSLTEAIPDTHDLQKKNSTASLERIDDSRTDLIPVMQVSVGKVFTPPKYVTQNLEKKDIVGKAKVIYDSSTDDRNAAFNGLKRVRELKQLPTPPTSPFNPLKRFVTNRPPLNHSISGLNELTSTKGMKSSKSMSDLNTDDTSFSIGSRRSSPVVSWIRRLFQKGTHSSADKNTRSSIGLNHISCELTGQLRLAESNTGKSSAPTVFVEVSKLLDNKQKCQLSMPPCDDEMQALVTRGSGSTGDLSKLDMLSSNRDSEGDLPQPSNYRSKSALYEKVNFDTKHHRNSLGFVFGYYLTIAGRSPSGSCDVLTAVAASIEYEIDVINIENDQESVSIDCRCSPIENKSDKHFTYYINTISDQEANAETSKTNVTDKVQENKTSSATRKYRPPPPSYPPPPLPPNVVIYV